MKFQVPTVGGIRKVIRPGGTVSSATTIDGLQGVTITIQQLAQLLANLTNTGGGNIGTGAEAAISVGPGLAGGGSLVGVVNIRLTAPLGSLGIVEDGADGNDGPPGPRGATGAAGAPGAPGIAGPALFMLADDGGDGDLGPPGPPGPQGAAGATGTTGSTGAQGAVGPGLFFLADDGQDGDQGPPGTPGSQGAVGAPGATGTTGSIGPIGVPGPGLFFLADDGTDGDSGPPGTPGPQGAAGAPGTPGAQGSPGNNASGGIYLLADDATNDDGMTSVIPQYAYNFTVNNTLSVNGSTSLQNGLIVSGRGSTAIFVGSFLNSASIAEGLNFNPTYGAIVTNTAISILSAPLTSSATTISKVVGFQHNDVSIGAGSSVVTQIGFACSPLVGASSNNRAFSGQIASAAGAYNLYMQGTAPNYLAGSLFIGNQTDNGSGAILQVTGNATYTSSIGIKGTTPAVTAGQTDLGITTTATVITTAGGIALPALASTFWRVNVNGVAYGIPCFAL